MGWKASYWSACDILEYEVGQKSNAWNQSFNLNWLYSFKALLVTLGNQFPNLTALDTQGQDILQTADKSDHPIITATNLKLKQDMQSLAEHLKQNQEVLEGTKRAKETLREDVDKCLGWLDETDADMRGVTPIRLPSERVEEELRNHEVKHQIGFSHQKSNNVK